MEQKKNKFIDHNYQYNFPLNLLTPKTWSRELFPWNFLLFMCIFMHNLQKIKEGIPLTL